MKKYRQSFNRIKTMISLGWEECCAAYFVGVPAQMAFYLFMSVLPLLILLSQLLGVFSLSLDEIQTWAHLNISDEGIMMIEDLLTGTPSGFGNIFLAGTAIWGASKSQYGFTAITNKIQSGGSYAGKGYLRDRARAILTTLVLLITFGLALVILIYAPAVLRLVFGRTQAMRIASSVWMNLRWLVVFALYFGVILLVNFSTQGRRPDFKYVLPGTVFTSLGFLLGSFLFRLYVRFSASRDIIYGALSNIVVLLMWFWFMSWILILGVVLNKVWDQTREIQRFNLYDDFSA